jgi:hypothetical protein
LIDLGLTLRMTFLQASTYSFMERLSHYMERRLINHSNWKTIKLAIMIEAGTLMRDRHKMEKEERERLFLSEYMNIIATSPILTLNQQEYAPRCFATTRVLVRRRWMVGKCGAITRMN